MIKYKRFFFAAPPRTGSTWFLKACSELGLGDGQKARLHEPPPDVWGGFLVSLVRHPYNWLASYYLSLKGGAIGVEIVDQLAPLARSSGSCYGFIERCATRMPGVVGRIFNSYKASTSMRLEDFPWAPTEFFDSLKICFGTEVITNITPQNSRKGSPHIPNERLVKLIRNTEKDFCERYDY